MNVNRSAKTAVSAIMRISLASYPMVLLPSTPVILLLQSAALQHYLDQLPAKKMQSISALMYVNELLKIARMVNLGNPHMQQLLDAKKRLRALRTSAKKRRLA
jgi:hypothetical protein